MFASQILWSLVSSRFNLFGCIHGGWLEIGPFYENPRIGYHLVSVSQSSGKSFLNVFLKTGTKGRNVCKFVKNEKVNRMRRGRAAQFTILYRMETFSAPFETQSKEILIFWAITCNWWKCDQLEVPYLPKDHSFMVDCKSKNKVSKK